MRILAGITIVYLLVIPLTSKGSYSFNQNCKKAYILAWEYKLSETRKVLAEEQKTNPANLIPVFIHNTADFINVFATEEPKAYEKYKSDVDKRLKLVEKEKNSPYYYFIRGEILLYDALMRVKFGEYISGAYELKQAYSNFTICEDKYPDFLPVKKNLVAIRAAIGTLPQKYKDMLSIFGMQGNLKESMNEYSRLLIELDKHPEYNIFTKESRILYSYLNLHLLNNGTVAWNQMKKATEGYKTDALSTFFRASMALHLRKNDEALTILSYHTQVQPVMPHLDFQYGVAKLQHGDKDAGFYLGRYLRTYKGKSYIKECYLKLAWAFLINGDEQRYYNCLKLVLAYGNATLEEDKSALKEAEIALKGKPSVGLVQARLFFDGGYFQKADDLLKVFNITSLNKSQLAEFHYRKARVAEALGDIKEALAEYEIVYKNYSTKEGYYAPASCYFAGFIYETQKNNIKAKELYTKCLNYTEYGYKDAFDLKATAGLKRIQ